MNHSSLSQQIKAWGKNLGFQQIGITDIDLSQAENNLQTWLQKKFHGEMHYMEKHGTMRSHPEELLPNTIRVISVRIDYLPTDAKFEETLNDKLKGFISRYALGRDYHKVIRKKLKKLAALISEQVDDHQYRVFVDSAPVLEKPLAQKAGLGWQGKHTNLINHKAGSWFFLGTIYTNIPLEIDTPATDHCGTCHACIDVCPTKAIVAPYQLDARRCISYLTIEHRGSIPIEFRKAIGNRIYGCDDCQIFCPWNKFAVATNELDFLPNESLLTPDLLELFSWSEEKFLKMTEGKAIRRISHELWLRNIAIALGNAPFDAKIITALEEKLSHPSELVREHVRWALENLVSEVNR